MKKSKYNYIVSYKNNYLLFNALLNTSVILNKDIYSRFLSNELADNEVVELNRLGFLVEDDFCEADAVLFASRNQSEKQNIFFYRIYTTMACNAKCEYCYEKNIKPISMNYQTADKLCEFIESKLKKDMHIYFEWFGGEPLLNYKIISYICEKLKPIFKANNVNFTSNMVSNGYLFNEQIIKKATAEWNLKKVQITLDGTKVYYENVKKFNQPNAFERVIENIKLLANNNVKVNIRLNYDENNLNEILKLINYLGKLFAFEGNVNVYARKIMRDESDNSFKASENLDILIYKELIKVGLVKVYNIINSIPRRTNMCIAHMINAYLVSPEGVLGKCSQCLFEKDKIGDVFSGENERALVKWCTPRIDNKCFKCKLLPICNGGCLYEKFKNKNYCYFSEKFLKFKLKTFLKYYVNNKKA